MSNKKMYTFQKQLFNDNIKTYLLKLKYLYVQKNYKIIQIEK